MNCKQNSNFIQAGDSEMTGKKDINIKNNVIFVYFNSLKKIVSK